MSVVVVGSVALDSIETPESSHEDVLGGAASYFSVAASFLSSPVRLVGVVGEDFPEAHVDFFRSRGIDLQGLKRVSGKTFRWKGRYLPDMVQRETLDTQLNVFETFQPQLSVTYRESQYIFLANIHPELQLEVLNQLVAPKLVALDTMNLWIETKREALGKVLERVDILLVNDEEARMLSEENNLLHAARKIITMGPKQVIIKRGDAGAMLFDKSDIFWAPAFPLEAICDPTGAGDSFAGGFISFLAHTNNLSPSNLRRAVVYGSVVASFAVEDFSLNRYLTLSKSDLVRRCQAFASLMRFEDIISL